jgi:hypothetical protein
MKKFKVKNFKTSSKKVNKTEAHEGSLEEDIKKELKRKKA